MRLRFLLVITAVMALMASSAGDIRSRFQRCRDRMAPGDERHPAQPAWACTVEAVAFMMATMMMPPSITGGCDFVSGLPQDQVPFHKAD
jgi:hypothetical protein